MAGFLVLYAYFSAEKLRRGAVLVADEPLFSGYVLIRLGLGQSAQSCAPICSTSGVSRLVSFGSEPVKVSDGLIEAFRAQEAAAKDTYEPLFKPGERVLLPKRRLLMGSASTTWPMMRAALWH